MEVSWHTPIPPFLGQDPSTVPQPFAFAAVMRSVLRSAEGRGRRKWHPALVTHDDIEHTNNYTVMILSVLYQSSEHEGGYHMLATIRAKRYLKRHEVSFEHGWLRPALRVMLYTETTRIECIHCLWELKQEHILYQSQRICHKGGSFLVSSCNPRKMVCRQDKPTWHRRIRIRGFCSDKNNRQYFPLVVVPCQKMFGMSGPLTKYSGTHA